MTSYKHRCGGTLYPAQVLVREETDLRFQWPVPGYRCDKCGEELIDHKTLTDIANSFLAMPWPQSVAGTSGTPPLTFLNVPCSTAMVA